MTNKNKSVKTINKKEKVDIFKLIREKKEEEKVIRTNWVVMQKTLIIQIGNQII